MAVQFFAVRVQIWVQIRREDLMTSPTYFAVRNARLDKEFEAARLAGDLRRMQGLLAAKTILLRRTYGWRTP
jgi:hypothetical protein